jgi:hypothetical protein
MSKTSPAALAGVWASVRAIALALDSAGMKLADSQLDVMLTNHQAAPSLNKRSHV